MTDHDIVTTPGSRKLYSVDNAVLRDLGMAYPYRDAIGRRDILPGYQVVAVYPDHLFDWDQTMVECYPLRPPTVAQLMAEGRVFEAGRQLLDEIKETP